MCLSWLRRLLTSRPPDWAVDMEHRITNLIWETYMSTQDDADKLVAGLQQLQATADATEQELAADNSAIAAALKDIADKHPDVDLAAAYQALASAQNSVGNLRNQVQSTTALAAPPADNSGSGTQDGGSGDGSGSGSGNGDSGSSSGDGSSSDSSGSDTGDGGASPSSRSRKS